jgi:hypothetical protein
MLHTSVFCQPVTGSFTTRVTESTVKEIEISNILINFRHPYIRIWLGIVCALLNIDMMGYNLR